MIRIPASRLRQCIGCGIDVDSNGKGIHRRVEAWIPCAKSSERTGGNNTLSMQKDLDRYICRECYDRLKSGIHPMQTTIFDALMSDD